MAAVDSIPIPPNVKDLTGREVGRWKVIAFSHIARAGHAYWHCACQCGTRRDVAGTSLMMATSKSCGCFNRDRAVECSTTHGKSRSPEYGVWSHILSRCYNTSDKSYSNYGGRGISVCSRWRRSFAAFYEDMGPRPSERHSVERIANEGNYEPSNCRWDTRHNQSRNTRRNRMLTLDGTTMCISDWSKKLGVTVNAIKWRLEHGWPIERALTQGVHSRT